MNFNIKDTLKNAFHSSIIVLKLVVPLYILADILLYFDLLKYISFVFEPVTSLLNLPSETALAIAAGVFLNLYAAIAFAAPLGLTPYEWTILGLFLGVCHSLIVESAIMKKIGISITYSVVLRVVMAFIAVFPIAFLPKSMFGNDVQTVEVVSKSYDGFWDMLINSFNGSVVLSLKVIAIIVSIIFVMDYIKSTKMMQNYMKKVNTLFSIFAGQILGITYGAGILIKESKAGHLSKSNIFYIATFLMICHSVIEDTLLFVIFGANYWIIVIVRLIMAIVFSYILLKFKRRECESCNV